MCIRDSVSGNAVNEPGNFRVPFGMNQAELVEAAGGFKTEPEKLISGGPMMGFATVSYTHLDVYKRQRPVCGRKV